MNKKLFAVSRDKKRARTQLQIPICENQADNEKLKQDKTIEEKQTIFSKWMEGL